MFLIWFGKRFSELKLKKKRKVKTENLSKLHTHFSFISQPDSRITLTILNSHRSSSSPSLDPPSSSSACHGLLFILRATRCSLQSVELPSVPSSLLFTVSHTQHFPAVRRASVSVISHSCSPSATRRRWSCRTAVEDSRQDALRGSGLLGFQLIRVELRGEAPSLTTNSLALAMAAGSPLLTSEHSKKTKPNRRKRTRKGGEAEKLDSLKWNPSSSAEDNDPFAFLVGSNELDGVVFFSELFIGSQLQHGGLWGLSFAHSLRFLFPSLEEIDKASYNLQIPKSKKGKPGKKLNSKKRKRSSANEEDSGDGDGDEDGRGVQKEEEKNLKNQKGKKKKKKKKSYLMVVVGNGPDDAQEELVNEAEISTEFDAWNELRLHPLLMKSIYKLGFKESTSILKARIPALAHQRKDVIGAAETESGKTRAFGLPALQRLLEEREKAAKMLEEKGEEAEKYAPKGHLRALIINPTRELALQGKPGKKLNSKKRKRSSANEEDSGDGDGDEDGRGVQKEEERNLKNEKGKKKKKKKKGKKIKTVEESVAVISVSWYCMLFDRVNVHLKIYVRLKDVSYNCGTVVVVSNGPDDAEEHCKEEDKDAYLYYILSVHGQGRAIVFCTSIAALRHIASLLKILGIDVWTLHAQMQQRARLKVFHVLMSGSLHCWMLADVQNFSFPWFFWPIGLTFLRPL
ncbi:DEAD-box ATP-dependent RNA helicase 13 [Citrus sinensis]|uniref:DEAD-box ATP-dependent RNA helicase 13 n=1 Tax=Citrus sinensis TaxID=2711 RepID=A0ACB8I3Z7_CITSI|nr:DEAD-box ATP-dependent RNA helicase 13 [Citrus sinensis]